MTYHPVFQISERLPDVVIGAIAFTGAIAVLVLALRRDWRAALRATSWFWLGAGAVLWALFDIHNIGGHMGFVVGVPPAVMAVALAILGWRDVEWDWNEGGRGRARSVAPIVAVVLLLLVALGGSQQWSAFGLDSRLSAGDASVVTGTVRDTAGRSWLNECFTVSSQRYCYDDSPISVGFHQTAANDGPIHDGLQVRVSSIGGVIVRLEILDG